MNSKWFYGALFLILAVLGVKMERSMHSNQAIVVRFTQDGFTQDKAQKAISQVKNQLQDVGVENIKIRDLEDGALKISYYSELGVSEIQKILCEAHLDTQGPLPTPFDLPNDRSSQDFAAYELNVYEIHDHSQIDIDLEGSPVTENQIKEHFYQPISKGKTSSLQLLEHYLAQKTSLNFCGKAATLQTLPFYSLPEVRAGPMV